MNKLTVFLTSTALAMALASPAFADSHKAQSDPAPLTTDDKPAAGDNGTTTNGDTGTTNGATGNGSGDATTTTPDTTLMGETLEFPIAEQEADQHMSSDILDMDVRGPDDEKIGTINDLILDDDHKVVGAVIGVGGFLGMGQKDVGVPVDDLALTTHEGKTFARVSLTKEDLESAPEFKTQAELKAEQEAERAKQTTPPAPQGGAAPTQ